ncbi:DUF938 domain-containing protein [Azorhizobium doebereinerae]|uniref:DUF938 domain-containing protein n=1 Tax=Azorhizobium doebereinerae TaxID=281091 RepID=UPI00048E983B|nr:DUF938 domain-containing protein [Azorhizobium doebereinerae]
MTQADQRPAIDPRPLSSYVAWAGNRNKGPILAVFKEIFPKSGDALELASGSGLHVKYFAPHFPSICFHPSDCDADVFGEIKSSRSGDRNANVVDPVLIDIMDPATFPNPKYLLFDVIFVINLFQVAPISIQEGVARLASSALAPDGILAIYGPFMLDGEYTAASNEAFDKEILAAGVAEWGLKDIRDLEKAAARFGLKLARTLDLPTNNFILLFNRLR